MPIHDWVRIGVAGYHDFQLGWASALCNRLNTGGLPKPLYAITETIDLRPSAEFAQFPEPDGPMTRSRWRDQLADAAESPPPVGRRIEDERRQYATVVVTVRGEFHQPLAVVMWATIQDRETPYRWGALTRFVVGALTRGIHAVVIDLFPPTARNPQALHAAVWGQITPGPFDAVPGKPLTFSSYSAGTAIAAYVEPASVGDPVPDMPLFLAPDGYATCPLAASYEDEWESFPSILKARLDEPFSD